VSEKQQWQAVEQLCSKLGQLAAMAQMYGSSESQKVEALELVQLIQERLPHSEKFETEQVPALLMELRNLPAPAPVTFRPQTATFGSRRELVEKFADEKKAVLPPAVVSVGKTDGLLPNEVAPAARSHAGVVCSFCGTQSSPEWRKGPNGEPVCRVGFAFLTVSFAGPKTLCNACGLVYSKMVKTRKVRQTGK
jgi:hypothetical protein